jgi:hypothetical protein
MASRAIKEEKEMDKIDAIEPSGLPSRVKAAGIAGVLMGAPVDSVIRGMVGAWDGILTGDAEKDTPVNDMPADYTVTERKLHEMLTENTGISIMDSGGDDNRSWQQNRKIYDFRKQPGIEVTVYSDGDVTFSMSVFHYLRDRVEYTDGAMKYTRRMTAYGRRNGVGGMYLMEDFIENLTGSVPVVFNSYNWESLLSQVIQGAYFTIDDVTYVALQVHNGCDVRGGYTHPVIFELRDGEYMMGDMDLTASCGCKNRITDDGGYHWYGYDNNDDGWPESWKGDHKNNKVICTECDEEVTFH